MVTGCWLMGLSLASCSLDEKSYTQLDQELVYNSDEGYEGLVNACYENLYYLYGKLDGIGPMEMGTDLWMIGSQNGGYAGITNYYTGDLNSVNGVNQVVWNALYAMVGYCNTAIYYGKRMETDTKRQKTAEAYFLRGFALFHIVEQWGDVVLDTLSMAEVGAGREKGIRSTEEDFYDRIISDLEYAAAYLPSTQGENGRATSIAAKAMLCKAWLQRTRLYSGGRDRRNQPYPLDEAKRKACAEKAYAYAQEVVQASELYPSDATSSGSTKCWDGHNNKTNKEFLFREAIDHNTFKNPENSNRGRTAQYYAIRESNISLFGIATAGLRYRRQNVNTWRPTLYLLTKCFEPLENTPDTRFSDSFYYKYYINDVKFSVLKSTCERYCKDISTFTTINKKTKKEEFKCEITGNVATVNELRLNHAGMNYFADNNSTWNFGEGGGQYVELEGNDAAMGVFTPNWPLDPEWCAKQKFLCANLTTQIFDNTGAFAGGDNSIYRGLTPSLKKFSDYYWCYTNQEWLGDFPIIRLTDIYLLGAEAAVVANNHLSEGLELLNTVRRHAALSTDADKMAVGMEAMNIDYILKERARELCGEQWRWYDLKRTGNITNEYLDNNLSGEPRNPWISNLQPYNVVRPIPQQFLDQIANPNEFGTNGY